MITETKFMSKEELMQVVGGNIKKICKDKKVNMMKLSEDIDMSYEYLRQIVSPKGKKYLSFYSIYKLAKTLDVSIDEFVEE